MHPSGADVECGKKKCAGIWAHASFTVFSTVLITNVCVLMSRRTSSLEVDLNGVVDTQTFITFLWWFSITIFMD
jgi:hypothetical protein